MMTVVCCAAPISLLLAGYIYTIWTRDCEKDTIRNNIIILDDFVRFGTEEPNDIRAFKPETIHNQIDSSFKVQFITQDERDELLTQLNVVKGRIRERASRR